MAPAVMATREVVVLADVGHAASVGTACAAEGAERLAPSVMAIREVVVLAYVGHAAIVDTACASEGANRLTCMANVSQHNNLSGRVHLTAWPTSAGTATFGVAIIAGDAEVTGVATAASLLFFPL